MTEIPKLWHAAEFLALISIRSMYMLISNQEVNMVLHIYTISTPWRAGKVFILCNCYQVGHYIFSIHLLLGKFRTSFTREAYLYQTLPGILKRWTLHPAAFNRHTLICCKCSFISLRSPATTLCGRSENINTCIYMIDIENVWLHLKSNIGLYLYPLFKIQ